MTSFINKFKIPTILGLAIIFLGIAAGVYLTIREQTFLSKAAPDLTPKNITFTDIAEDSVAVSWQTNSPVSSFITYGQNNPGEQTALDDKDNAPVNGPAGTPKTHTIHYVTLKNLLPKTKYLLKIISGQLTSDTREFETAQPATNQSAFSPIIGSVLDGDTPLDNGIAYLSIPNAVTQSALVKTGGSFLIPLTQTRKTDLSDGFEFTENMPVKLTITSDKGTSSVLFNLKTSANLLPPIKIGQNIDLTVPEEATPEASSNNTNISDYDLNNDGKVNSTDYGLFSSCFGKKPNTSLSKGVTCTKADINGDGKIDQKDLDLMSQKLKEPGS